MNAGDLVTVICAVSKGDLPINITWNLNSDLINLVEGLTTSSANRRTNQLTIESAQAHHSGKYTCIAQNQFGVAKYSSYLNVNGIFIIKIIEFPTLSPSFLTVMYF